jgi:hypothetical protein
MALAADLLHAHHLRLIGTPSVSLVNIVAPGPGRVFPRFIDAGIAGGVAKSADVIDIQAQGSVRDPQLYTSFVTEAAAQARLANPEVIVLAGLSTNPSGAGGDVSVDQLAADVRMTQAAVEGYWLNVPVPGPYCPRCTGARPDLAVALLRALASS